jgi:hypothetical protein
MPRPSKIDRLPLEFRDAIGRLREDGHTLDEILVYLKKMGLDADGMPSRSGLHRHVQGLEELADLLHTSRSTAEILTRRLGDEPEGRRARFNIEVLQAIVTNLMAASVAGDGAKFDAKQVSFLSKALNDLAKAQASDLSTTLKLRAEARKEMEAKLDQVEAEVEDGAAPLTPLEMLARIRALYSGEA